MMDKLTEAGMKAQMQDGQTIVSLQESMKALQAMSRSYFTTVLVDTKKNRYKAIHVASWMKHLPLVGCYTDVVRKLTDAMILKEYHEMVLERLSPEYMRQHLRESELSETEQSYDIEYQVFRSGGKKWIRVTVVTVEMGMDGCPDSVLVLLQDITKNKEKEREHEEMMRAYELSERANQAKTTFLNNMSHDIRTPMNAIIGFASLAAIHIDETERLKDYLSKIMVSSNHLLSLINDVLDMSRIESGRVKIEENECSIPVVMHDLRNILQTDIRAKRMEFFIDTVDVVNEDVICDRLRLNQILLNCVNNAIKYTPAGGTVGVRIIQKENAPAGFADYDFVIRDTGIGMSQEFMAHIFEPFSREETSTVSRIPGTGLGMSITKNIVDMMGGSIRVKSKPDVGSEFTISLRFKTANSSQRRGVIKELKGFRALVADDSMESCVSVEKMLRTIGLRPEWTTSGKEAVFRAQYAKEQNDPFSVFVIDWLMPDMNGIEVVRRIRMEIGEDVPIIILTAYDWSDIEQEAREAGVTAFCAKPLFMSELYDVLQNASQADEQTRCKEFRAGEFEGKHILLVEDVELNREIAETILIDAGFQVSSVENGQRAVEYMRQSPTGFVDLVLMDVMMPEMDGYEATRQIRRLENQKNAQTPIIALTANAFDTDIQKALDAGMNDHLAKPISIEALYGIMKKHL